MHNYYDYHLPRLFIRFLFLFFFPSYSRGHENWCVTLPILALKIMLGLLVYIVPYKLAWFFKITLLVKTHYCNIHKNQTCCYDFILFFVFSNSSGNVSFLQSNLQKACTHARRPYTPGWWWPGMWLALRRRRLHASFHARDYIE